MVDDKMLEQLGWSDDLIKEVTRSSDLIRKTTPTMKVVESPWIIDETSFASDSFQLSSDTGVSNSLFVSREEP